jgi:hypothetical protein
VVPVTWQGIRGLIESTGTLFYPAIQITLNSDRFQSRLYARRYSVNFNVLQLKKEYSCNAAAPSGLRGLLQDEICLYVQFVPYLLG